MSSFRRTPSIPHRWLHRWLQEEASARAEAERLRIEQQIQAERRAAEQYAVSKGTESIVYLVV